MPNIQLPIKTDLPAAEPLARAPRSSDAASAQPTFDDHLERAARPEAEPASPSRPTDKHDNDHHSTDQKSTSEATSVESRNETEESPQDNENLETEAVADDAKQGEDDSTTNEADVEEEVADADQDPSEVLGEVITLADGETAKLTTEGKTKGIDAENAPAVTQPSEKALSGEQAAIADGKLTEDAATESVDVHEEGEQLAKNQLAKNQLAKNTVATDVTTAAETDEEEATLSNAAVRSGDGPKVTSVNDTAASETENGDHTTATSTAQQPTEGDTQDSANDRPKRDSRDAARNERSSRTPNSAASTSLGTSDKAQGPSDDTTGQNDLADAARVSTTRESTIAAATNTPAEGTPEPSTSATSSVDNIQGPGNSMSRAVARAAAQLEPAPVSDGNLNESQRVRFVQRVAGAFKAAGERDGTVRVRLSPPELGSLRLQVTVKDGVMVAQLETETPEARRILLENLPELRDRLAQQDVKVERFDVDVRDEDRGQQAENSETNDGPNNQPSDGEPDDSSATDEPDATQDTDSQAAATDSDQLNIVI